MPGLLDLPREIRDKVLSLVLATPIAPPQKPDNAIRRKEIRKPKSDPIQGWFDGEGVQYAPGFSRIDLLPTLLSNRELYNESLVVISSLNTKSFYELEVMLVNEKELWPTWTFVPVPTAHAQKVKASFRTFGCREKGPGNRYGGFTEGAGGPPLITWSFYSFLARFLSLGQNGLPANEAERGTSISVLEPNFSTPSGPIAPRTEIEVYGYSIDTSLYKLRMRPVSATYCLRIILQITFRCISSNFWL